ncbi:MAG: HDIG domain-containing protein [Chloroflexi bacterium]|jgi:putative nucleotidyltransferase with HDIG domain|nr:HDIG domain-containing protein [Chloroflexota bacterium]MBT7080754.1 HDIG domain-containing protein [Chloroflexota bacterium]MBT7290163.1 HDIG domain-containing protein [Chloroflexota bacterium]
MERKYALLSVESNIENVNTIKHMLATEAVMIALAKRLGEDEDEWSTTGLIHDVDVELTEDDPHSHSTLGADMARDMGAGEAVAKAILCHNHEHGIPCVTPMEKALYAADPLTGLITASVMIRPDQKIAGLTLDSLKKRYDEKRFAAGANRDQIATCSTLGIELDDFLEIGLTTMQADADQLGL